MKFLGGVLVRFAYVFIGVFIAYVVGANSYPEEILVPDWDNVEFCMSYDLDSESVGQFCHMKTGYTYLYMADPLYFFHVADACNSMIEEYEMGVSR